jgi:lipopolysaccharide export system protein LptA
MLSTKLAVRFRGKLNLNEVKNLPNPWYNEILRFAQNDRVVLFAFFAWLFAAFTNNVFSQDKITLNHADSLIGKVIEGQQVREAIGNVELTHAGVKIYANRVLQYTDMNKAELYGNVKMYKDTLSIFAPAGIYYGNEGKVICPNGATLNDSKATLKANTGIYYFAQDLASFKGSVSIYDSKSYVITSNELDYYRSQNRSIAKGNVKIVTDSSVIYSDNLDYEKSLGKSVATGNVKIESDSTVITSDKLTYFDFEKKSVAEEKVKINFLNKNAIVYGDYSENYERTNYSFVKGKTRLIQIEKGKTKEDTLYIWSEKMESFRDKPERYKASDSVKVIRADFLSSSNVGYYFKKSEGHGGTIALGGNPVVWKENLQVTGDSIYAFFGEDLERVYVTRSAFAVSTNEEHENRFDQIAGVFMFLKFVENKIDYIQVDTNAACIYFSYENKDPNGANRVYGSTIGLSFNDEKITKVNVIGAPKGTFFPENLVNLSDLLLPGFRVRTNKPVRQ